MKGLKGIFVVGQQKLYFYHRNTKELHSESALADADMLGTDLTSFGADAGPVSMRGRVATCNQKRVWLRCNAVDGC
jgi:hypothetical protein